MIYRLLEVKNFLNEILHASKIQLAMLLKYHERITENNSGQADHKDQIL
jgi:hypothetical protein